MEGEDPVLEALRECAAALRAAQAQIEKDYQSGRSTITETGMGQINKVTLVALQKAEPFLPCVEVSASAPA